MPRVKSSVASRNRRKKTLKLAKGYYGSKHRLYRTANEQVMRSLRFAYRDRRQLKREMRKLWITRINAAARMHDLSYSQFMHGLKVANIDVNRKMLSEIAIHDPKGFESIVSTRGRNCVSASQAIARCICACFKSFKAGRRISISEVHTLEAIGKRTIDARRWTDTLTKSLGGKKGCSQTINVIPRRPPTDSATRQAIITTISRIFRLNWKW